MSIASPIEEVGAGGSSLPAFVERARDDALCRAALARLGYANVKVAYAQQMRDGTDIFRGLESENLAPPMDLVRDWLKTERRRNLGHVRWTFFGTMLATIVTGLAFAAAYSILG